MTRLIRFVTTCLLLIAGTAWPAFAQQPADAFQPVAPGDLNQEQIPAAPLVFAAYAFVWVCFVVYLFVLWQKLRRVETELAEVRSKLAGDRR